MKDQPHFLGHRQRLRERFRSSGGEGFADYELLELLLTYAIPRRDVKPLAKTLIEKNGSLKGVLNLPVETLSSQMGLGPGGALLIPLVRRVMDRFMETRVKESDLLNSPHAVVAYCRASLEGLKNEVFDVIYLSTKNRVIGRERLSEGTIDQTVVHARRLLSGALEANAASLIFVHNHPSGDPAPSLEDKQLTRRLADAAATLSITVHDHIIVGNGRHFSFRDQGLLS